MHVKENNAEFMLRILSLICCLSGDNIDSRDSKFEKKELFQLRTGLILIFTARERACLLILPTQVFPLRCKNIKKTNSGMQFTLFKEKSRN